MRATRRLSVVGWIAALVTAAALAGGCSSGTTMQSVWKDPAYTAGPLKNVVVVAVVPTASARRMLEDTFVTSLTSSGVKATPSYQLFPGDLPDKDAARARIQEEGFDAVLVSRATDKEHTVVYSGGTTYWGGYYGGWGAYGGGTAFTEEYVTFSNSVWDPRGEGQLIWSGNTETLNPDSGPKFAASLVGRMMPELTKAGLLPPASQGK